MNLKITKKIENWIKKGRKKLNSENLKNVIEFENYKKIENWIKKGIKKTLKYLNSKWQKKQYA